MEQQQLSKIKISIVFFLSLSMSYLAWSLIQSHVENGPLAAIYKNQSGTIFFMALVLVVVSGMVGHFFGNVEKQSLGLFAVPAALCFWVFKSGGVTELLKVFPNIEQRVELFYRLILETGLWALVLFAGFGGVSLILRLRKSKSHLDDSRKTTASLAKQKSGSEKKEKTLWDDPKIKGVVGLLVCCLIAIILLKIFMQSGKTWTEGALSYEVSFGPVKGQVLFAIFASFYLGSLAVKFLFKTPATVLLAAPAVVAIGSYLYVAHKHLPQDILDRSPEMVLPAVRFGLALPIEFMGFGCLAVICGYWSQFQGEEITVIAVT